MEEEGGIRGGQDRPRQMTKTMAVRKTAEEMVLATIREGASLRAETAMEGW